MGWESINLSEVEVQTGFTPLPASDYTLRVLGAEYDTKFPGQLNINLAVTDGEYTNRRVFASLPDPAKFDWSPRALRVLSIALGTDPTEGEDPVSYLNRVATNGHATFTAPVTVAEFTRADGSKGAKNQVMFFKSRPAA